MIIFSHSSFPCSNNKTDFPLHDSNSCCFPYSFCILLRFLPTLKSGFPFLFPSPPILSSLRQIEKIQSHFRHHASPSFLDVTKVADITLRVVPGWKRRKRRGCNFLFDVRMRFFFDFLFEVVFLYTRL